MKDSHIGTYGVLGLILYILLLWGCLSSLTPWMAALAVFAADPYAKMVTSQLVVMMPYARREEEAKAKVVCLSKNLSPQRSESRLSRLAALSTLHLVHRLIVGDTCLYPCPHDVFPLSAYLAQATRLYWRLLWSCLSAC